MPEFPTTLQDVIDSTRAKVIPLPASGRAGVPSSRLAHERAGWKTPIPAPAENYPRLTLATDGSLACDYAPEVACFSLSWLTSENHNPQYIQVDGDLVSFLVTGGPPVTYRITGYNITARRFFGTLVENDG